MSEPLESTPPTPPATATQRSAAGGDPDELPTNGEWDGQARAARTDGHYDYEFLLRADRLLHLYFAVALLPVLYSVAEMAGAIAYSQDTLLGVGSACLDMTGLAIAFLLQRWPSVAAMIGYCLFALLQLFALVSGFPAVWFGLGGFLVLGISGGAFLWYRDLKDQVRHRQYPAEVRNMVGRMSKFFALRAWIKLQREADQAEQSLAWQNAPATATAPKDDGSA